MPVVRLTNSFITRELTCPDGVARIEYCDADRTGLHVEVRATSPGQGTYYLRYKNALNKTAHQKLGRITEISLAEARKCAKLQKAAIVQGADPRAEERARRAVITFSEFFDEQYLPHAKAHKRSWDRDVQLFRRIRDVFGRKRLNEITRHQIQDFYSSVRSKVCRRQVQTIT